MHRQGAPDQAGESQALPHRPAACGPESMVWRNTGGGQCCVCCTRPADSSWAGRLGLHLVHLQDGTVLGLDALQEAGLREDELDGGGVQLVVALGLGLLPHKL